MNLTYKNLILYDLNLLGPNVQICGIHIFGCLYRILKDEGLSEQSSGER